MSPAPEDSDDRDNSQDSKSSDDRKSPPEVRVVRAQSFDGYVVLEGTEVVAVAFGREEALKMIDKIRAGLDPEAED